MLRVYLRKHVQYKVISSIKQFTICSRPYSEVLQKLIILRLDQIFCLTTTINQAWSWSYTNPLHYASPNSCQDQPKCKISKNNRKNHLMFCRHIMLCKYPHYLVIILILTNNAVDVYVLMRAWPGKGCWWQMMTIKLSQCLDSWHMHPI